ncbi:hypothetical protein HMPREF1981_00469, partial [Bacteroides pyogenes F0041]
MDDYMPVFCFNVYYKVLVFYLLFFTSVSGGGHLLFIVSTVSLCLQKNDQADIISFLQNQDLNSVTLLSRPLKTIFQREVRFYKLHADFFISHKRTLIALLKLYAAAANKTLIAS